MTIILGAVSYDNCVNVYNKNSGRTNHFHNRQYRLNLCSQIADPLHYFEVYREKDNSFQIHCLYEDASLLVFNKKEKKLITIILLNVEQVQGYLNRINEDIYNNKKLKMSAKLNSKLPENLVDLEPSYIKEIVKKKDKYMMIG